MSPAPKDAASRRSRAGGSPPSAPPRGTPRPQRLASLPRALALLLVAFVLLPRVHEHASLVWTYTGVAAALLVWDLILRRIAKTRGQPLRVDLVPPVKSHYIQATVQLSVYAYWGWYWREIYSEAPLIFSQLVFLYVFDALLTWTRGRSWRLGFGPLPIILSINVFIWFRDEWFVFQFLLVALCALGKEFIRWNQDGRSTHVFNPSAFGLTVVSLVLIVTGTTRDITWAGELASTIDKPPHIYLEIFLLGLVVSYFFSVTLMVMSATAVLVGLNLIYTANTGVYQFVSTNLSAAVFLGLHLLVTDPATSPRTNVGRVIFGSLYGLGNWVLFDVLGWLDAPELYTKLLMVPILNLGVPWIDRIARAGIVGALNRAWESALRPKAMNLVHMGCWAALFMTMWTTGFVEGPHEGNSIAFWKKAHAEGKPKALKKMILVSLAQASDASGAANNEVGLICMEGNELVRQSNAKAARYFATACALGDVNGCANVASQFLFMRERRTEEDLALAFQRLERSCDEGTGGLGCYLVGSAYETGRGRPLDRARAIELYRRCGFGNLFASKGLARIALSPNSPPCDLKDAALVLGQACEAGDAESCWYLAYMHHRGTGVPRDERKSRELLERACSLGSKQACEAMTLPELPPFSNPVMSVPGWSTAFPIP